MSSHFKTAPVVQPVLSYSIGGEIDGRPGGIRTPNTRIWSPVLYPLELLASLNKKASGFKFEDWFP